MPKKSARNPSLTSQESYSAVIIADLVADVPIFEANEAIKRPSVSKDKKEINYGYDDQLDGESGSAAVVPVDSMETVNLRAAQANGAGISKGVILNAMQFGVQDTKLSLDSEKNEKPIALTNDHAKPVAEVPKAAKEDTIAEVFSQMSVMRKFAFGISFLPSILFVLCFAIILPCEKPVPCIQENFLVQLNNTEISRVKVADNFIFTTRSTDGNTVTSIDEHNQEIFKVKTEESSRFIDCGNVASPKKKDCFVMFESGKMYFFNASNGNIIWDRNLTEGNINPSDPVILPDCNGDGIAEIAMAVSRNKIKILSHGNIVYSIDLSGCEKVPSKLTAWTKNTTDLIFVCRKKDSDLLLKIPQNVWCYTEKEILIKESILLSRKIGDLDDSIILPTKEGLVVWVKDELFLINPAGITEWTISTVPHLRSYRFLLHGKFQAKGNHIALFSSVLSSELLMTTVNFENGNTTWTKSIRNAEATDVVHIQGKEKDFALVVMKKIFRPKDLASEAVAHINGVSSTIVSFIANEEIKVRAINLRGGTLTEETYVMELDGKDDGLFIKQEAFPSADDSYNRLSTDSTLAVRIEDTESRPLKLIIVSSPKRGEAAKNAFIRSITVVNWDTSLKEHQCVPK